MCTSVFQRQGRTFFDVNWFLEKSRARKYKKNTKGEEEEKNLLFEI